MAINFNQNLETSISNFAIEDRLKSQFNLFREWLIHEHQASSFAEIADLTNLPISTLYRLEKAKVKKPTWALYSKVIRFMGNISDEKKTSKDLILITKQVVDFINSPLPTFLKSNKIGTYTFKLWDKTIHNAQSRISEFGPTSQILWSIPAHKVIDLYLTLINNNEINRILQCSKSISENEAKDTNYIFDLLSTFLARTARLSPKEIFDDFGVDRSMLIRWKNIVEYKDISGAKNISFAGKLLLFQNK
ncbi:hypothetical protein ESZ50_02435 [Weissella muntiaci]|uniref:Uncharacterized protein n=1 Tax=Weissella muntiaci TaxID=2508881 RepID=A0A6C2CAF2_9LACO|nr:hypothetical protein [Weissella muntiaci]TYC50546.1 hypothetical protein ESZ50_02435 [Weissella muntiaci]